MNPRTKRDAIARKQARLYRLLLSLDAALVAPRDAVSMLQQLCDTAFLDEKIAASWASMIDAQSGLLEPIAYPPKLAPFRQLVRGLANAGSASDYSPTVRAVATQSAQFIDRMRDLPLPAVAKPLLHALGIEGVAALPLRLQGRTVGAVTLYVTEPDYFDEETRQALMSVSERLSRALDHIDAVDRLNSALLQVSEHEARFRALVEQSIAGIYMIDGGRFTYVNLRMCEILGRSREEVLKMAPGDVTLEEDRPLVVENVRRRLEGEIESVRFEFRVCRPSGEVRHVGAHGSVALHSGRRVIIGILQDITDRMLAEERVAHQLARTESAMRSTIGAVSQMVELRDPYTAGHERRVGAIMLAIGEQLGMPAEQRAGLEVIGGLHDIGKIAAPAEILSKPGRLSATEFDLVKEHSRKGFEILDGTEFPWPVAQVTLQHHERMDGSGYPQGLKGEAIILEARIAAIADTVEAMSSHRPYRPGLGIDVALAEIERGRGKLYDSDAATACLKLFREKAYSIPQ